MTTIVCTQEGMAADRRISNVMLFKSTKIFRVNGSLIGIAGHTEQALRFVEWRRDPDVRPNFVNDPEFSAIELSPDGKMTYWGTEMVGIPIEEPFYAIGSGAPIALGAMAMGATPKKAIQVASRWDNATGADVQVINLRAKV